MKEFVEKLIGRLEEELRPDKECFEYEDDYMYAEERHNKMLKIVNQIAGEYNNGWIPVEKTLPKKSGYYTVTEEQYSLDMRKKMGVRVSHEVQFDAEEQRWHRAKFLKVIAWKEHETPYQPKGE